MPSASKSKPTGQKAPEAGTGGALSRLGELGWQALPAIGSAIGFAGFVAVIGAAIEWIRFDAANLPATQAVLAVPEKELVIVGALALAAFVLGAVLAVVLVYLIDSNGDATPNTARGLVAVGFFEMVATLCFIEVHHPVAYALLGIWLVVIGLAAAYVVAAVMADFTRRTQMQHARAKMVSAHEKLEEAEAASAVADAADVQFHTDVTAKARQEAQLALLSATRAWEGAIREWVTAADAIIAEPRKAEEAVHGNERNREGQQADLRSKMEAARERVNAYASGDPPNVVALKTTLDDAERDLGHIFRVVGDHLLAQLADPDKGLEAKVRKALAALEVSILRKDATPGAPASKPRKGGYLLRFAWAGGILAVVWLVVGLVLIVKEGKFSWVALLLGVAAVLAMMNLFVARGTEKFAWYGVSVFFSVLLFGAALTIARTLATPSVQPIALVRTGEDVGICGVYVAQTSERVYVGRRELRGHRPGLIFWVPTKDIDLVDVGQSEPINSEFSTLAVAMLSQLYKDRAEEATQPLKNTTVTKVEDGAKAGETTTTVRERPPKSQTHPTRYPEAQVGDSCTSS